MLGKLGTAKTSRVLELLDTARTVDEIAAEAGCSSAYVSQVKRKLYRQSLRPAVEAPAPRKQGPVRVTDTHGTPRPIVDRLGPHDHLVEMDGGEITIERAGDCALVAVHEQGRTAAVVRGDRDDLTDLIEQLTAVRDALPEVA